MFNEDKLKQIRAGMTMNGKKYGPYLCEVEKRQNTNTWLHMKLYEGKNNEIRRVMRKLSLRVNRLIRVKYGPYSLGMVPEPNDLVEVTVTDEIRRLLYRYYKARASEASRQLEES
jgi:23S rRNA pseudouridine2605 synthase